MTDLLVDGNRVSSSSAKGRSRPGYRLYFDALRRMVKATINNETFYYAYLVGGPYAVLDSRGKVLKRRLVTDSGETPFAEPGVELFPNGDRQYLVDSPLAGAGLLYSVSLQRGGARGLSVKFGPVRPQMSMYCSSWQTTDWDADGNATVTNHSSCYWVDDGGGGGGGGGGGDP